jgi:hypothetical protein
MKLASIVAWGVTSAAAAIAIAAASCSDKQPDTPLKIAATQPAPVPVPVPAPAPAPPAPPPETSSTTLPAEFPSECVSYAALIDKLKACDKLGGARDGLMAGYNGLRSAWSTIPADQRGGIAGQCRTQEESLRNAAAATCGW